jgi:argonaute-like protein implicated in RNA metabolism and viral defense
LAELETGVCFVGISFYRELNSENPRVRTSMAQAFTAAGDGYILRGSSFEWDEAARGRSPHMNKELAASLLRDVIELYTRQNRGSLPSRIVVHKSSRFWADELEGLAEASESIPRKDFVALGSRGLQFYRTGDYPPLRGTYIKFSNTDLLLYTSGYVPFLRTYPGARVPQPLEILELHGDSPWDVVLKETLALTKMNWNTADFACRDPITIAFSKRVGQILAEVSPNSKIQPEYRFYM